MGLNKRWLMLWAMLAVFGLVAAACGSDDDGGDEVTAEEDAPVEEEPPAEVDPIVETFDVNGDGAVTIGVAAAGPRNDGAYYQAVVDFAEGYSAENGFNEPIVVDNIQAADAATELSNLAQQGVDIIFVGASEIAEPLPDLTEQFGDIFWYCNCGAGFPETPGLAQTVDWGAAIHYTAGVAMGAVLQETGGTKGVFIGCCDLGFEKEAYNATLVGLEAVDPSFEMEYVPTGEFPFDFDNTANATAALANAEAEGATLAYAYLGGAAEPVAQAATESGTAVFAAGPADVCSRDDGIAWTGTIAFDGGEYAEAVFPLIIAGELTEGQTYTFETGPDGINGARLCDPSPEAQTLVDESFTSVTSDGELLGVLGQVSADAYAAG